MKKQKHLTADEAVTHAERRQQKKRNQRKMKVSGASVKQLRRLQVNQNK